MRLLVKYFRPRAEMRQDCERAEIWEKLLPSGRLRARSRQGRAERGRLCGDTPGDTAPGRAGAAARGAPPTLRCGPPPRPSARGCPPPAHALAALVVAEARKRSALTN